MRLALAPFAALLLAACGSDPATTGGFPADALTTVTSDHGLAILEVRTSPQPPTRGSLEVEYTVTKAGAPLDGLTIAVTPFMPDMGHGATVDPTVTAEGDGRYRITDVEVYMAGRWELRTTLSGAIEDTAVVELQVQ
jgi:hypothetical protein